ncbi:hypothetical protein VCNEP21106_003517A, partial [Vibrio cholerae O1 str. Nep-21106]
MAFPVPLSRGGCSC